MRRILIGILACAIVMAMAAFAFGEPQIYEIKIQKSGGQYYFKLPGQDPTQTAKVSLAPSGSCVPVKFTNETGDVINVDNTQSWPVELAERDVPLGIAGTATLDFCCPTHKGTYFYEVGSAKLYLTISCAAAVPSLTQWGMIALGVLILAAGALVIVRRRRIAVQA